jgi:hypothetical protein
VEHGLGGGNAPTCRILFEVPERRVIGWEDAVDSGQRLAAVFCECSIELPGFIESWQFLDQPSQC